MTYGDHFANIRTNLHKYSKLFFAIVIAIFLVELFLVFFPNWSEPWDQDDMKDRIFVSVFIVMKLIIKVLLLSFIIYYSFKSVKLYSEVKSFSSLETSTCVDDTATTMFSHYGDFLLGAKVYDKSSITFSFINIIVVCF